MRPLIALLAALLASGCSSPRAPMEPGTISLVDVGDRAPQVRATAHDGASIETGRAGETMLVYFYPKDSTPGCTKEACAFRDVWERFERANVRVVGVSADSADSHRAFAKEHALPFPLVADTELAWAKAFGVPTIMGVTRRVSILLHDGRVAKVYPDVDPGVHATEVLADATRVREPQT